jgi:hypothetical protein
MYTRPQFRRLGLAKLVEQKLSIMNLEQWVFWKIRLLFDQLGPG